MKNPKQEMYVTKRDDGEMYPADGWSAKLWAKLRVGTWKITFQKVVNQKRNIYYHNKYFAMIRKAFENQERFPSSECLRRAVLIESGFYTWEHRFNLRNPEDATSVKVANSMSFKSMNQTEFELCYTKSVDTLIKAFGWDENMFNILMSFI